MGELDSITKQYMSNNVIFADVFNFRLYDGRPVIRPEDLRDMDATELEIPYRSTEKVAIQKQRDLLKRLTIKTDGKVNYILLGIENQTELHYAMPVRNMLYDALQYSSQISQKEREHRKERDAHGAEFLSGFTKEDKLIPVITMVVYFGADEWTAPRSLREMYTETDETLAEFLLDYKICLIEPYAIREEDLPKFRSLFQYVAQSLKYADDKVRLRNLWETNPIYHALEHATALLLSAVTKCRINTEQKEDVNMCKAIQEMLDDSRQEGRQEGIEQVAQNMLACGVPMETVTQYTGLNAEQLLALAHGKDVAEE